LGNPLDSLSALHNHFHGFGANEDFKRNSSAWHSVKMANVKAGPEISPRSAKGWQPASFPSELCVLLVSVLKSPLRALRWLEDSEVLQVTEGRIHHIGTERAKGNRRSDGAQENRYNRADLS